MSDPSVADEMFPVAPSLDDALADTREPVAPCLHCFSTGWCIMGAENDFGAYEEYYVLCRKCGGRG